MRAMAAQEERLRLHAKEWPEELDAEFLAQEFDLEPEELDRPTVIEAQLAALELSRELEEEFGFLLRALDQAAERKWRAGQYHAYPIVQLWDKPADRPPVLVGAAVVHRGWIVEMDLLEGEEPEFEDLWQRVRELDRERALVVRRILKR
jgi:hypothetical protein